MEIIKFNNINEICSKYKFILSDDDISYREFILELFNNNIFDSNTSDSNMLNWIGLYYQYQIKDYESMKKYYLIAFKLDCGPAAHNLGWYYHIEVKNYEIMEKYYLKAIELGCGIAANNLGYYHEIQVIDYQLMKKYYLKAIELGCGIAANNLGDYYRYQEKDYELMEKYYLKAIELSYNQGLENLEDFYSNDKLKLYKILINWKNTVENVDLNIINFINEKLFILEKENESIKFYNNKINTFTKINNYKKCILCMDENVLNIIYNCGHEICIDCYCDEKLFPCGICQITKNN